MPNFPYKEPLIQAVILQSCKAFFNSHEDFVEHSRGEIFFLESFSSALHIFLFPFSSVHLENAKKEIEKKTLRAFL